MPKRTERPPPISEKNTAAGAPLAAVQPRLTPADARRLEEAMETMQTLLETVLPDDGSFEDHERAVLEITNEVARRQLAHRAQRGLARLA